MSGTTKAVVMISHYFHKKNLHQLNDEDLWEGALAFKTAGAGKSIG